MKDIEEGSFAAECETSACADRIRIVSWNINRGLRLDGVIEFLRSLAADLILLQEADVNAYRTRKRDIGREIAQALRMNYVFGREFEELGQGSSASPAYHGQVTLSRFPLEGPRIVEFTEQSNFWRPLPLVPHLPWLQRRLGARMALCCKVRTCGRELMTYNAHLESRGSDALRCSQLSDVIADSRRWDGAVVVAGDFNFDVRCSTAWAGIGQTGFVNPFHDFDGRPTASMPRRRRSAAIDCILLRGPLRGSDANIHSQVSASDHFPLSVELHWG